MLNKVILMGRLTRDPELRYTQSNVPVCSFTLAVDRGFSKKDEQSTDFISIVTWRNTAEFVSKWFRKGQLVAVSGSIQTRSWKNKDGENRYATEVCADECFFADSKPGDIRPDCDNAVTPHPSAALTPSPQGEDIDVPVGFEELIGEDGELPF